MRELDPNDSIATLTVAELKTLIEQIIEQREARHRTPSISKQADVDRIVALLQADGTGGRLFKSLLSTRHGARDSEC